MLRRGWPQYRPIQACRGWGYTPWVPIADRIPLGCRGFGYLASPKGWTVFPFANLPGLDQDLTG